MDPSMNTEPESNMYQHVDSSPVLFTKEKKKINGKIIKGNTRELLGNATFKR